MTDTMTEKDICSCGTIQWSPMDQAYLKLFGNCWGCDREAWQDQQMTTEELEGRELEAFSSLQT